MKYIIALFLFLFTSTAFADQIFPVRLVVVKRSDITTQQQIDLFNQSIARFSEVKVKVKVVQVIETPDVINENDYSYYLARLFSWADWGKKNKLQTKGVHVHYLLPPVVSGTANYGGGVAGGICTTRRRTYAAFSYSIMRLVNTNGEDRIENSLVATTHELLHALGANHVDNHQNVMRSYYNPGPQPILPLTKRHLKYCNQGKTPNGVFARSFVRDFDRPVL